MLLDIETFKLVCEKAHAAGMKAVSKLNVIPMIVGSETHPFSGVMDMKKQTYFVADGVCGFAWVNVYPEFKGNTRNGKDERKMLEAAGFHKNGYEKTYQLWISDFNQSIQKKETYARAYAEVLRENGFKSYAGSRLD